MKMLYLDYFVIKEKMYKVITNLILKIIIIINLGNVIFYACTFNYNCIFYNNIYKFL